MSGPPPTGTGPNYSMAEPSRRDWHLTDPEQALFDTSHFGGSIDLYGAWGVLGQNAGQNGADAGNGTVIGHPDSGFQPHSDYPVSQVDEERAYNAFEDRITPESLAVGGLNVAHHPFAPLNFPYYVQHGTYTASVIAAPQTNPTANETVGVAPGATILPLRCVDTVVLAGDYDIVRAIEHAVASDVDVISISLGGAPNPALLDALRYAIGNGTIVIAASGQGGGVAALPNQVAVPAAWAEVIAVAGSIGNRAWFGCFNGPEVDFCAPAVQINHATFSSQGVEGNGFGSGTSFAAAITAGVAALWLQHHGGRAAIEAAVPGVTVQQVFRHLAKQTAYTPAEFPDRTGFEFWRGDLFGSGILHARRLLEAGLPDPQDVPGFERFRPPNTYVAASGLALTGTNGRDVLEGVVWLMGAAGAIASAAATTAATTGQIIGDFISNVTAGVGAVGTSFAANWFGAVGAASPVAGAALAAANAAQAWQDALAAAGSVGGDLGEWLSEQADAAEEAWNAAEDAADEALEGAEEAVEDFVEETSEFIEDVAEEASETGSEIVDDVVGALNSLFG
ncbi:MAG: S8 family serine peptidase [Pseudomonadota bacterium]